MSRRKWIPGVVLWLLAAGLLYLALRDVHWRLVFDVFSRLTVSQILILVVANLLVIVLLAMRWWIILRAQGAGVSLLRIVAYRLAGFGISYFTPGPQIGGEPFQVILLNRRDEVPLAKATASVTLDKLLELTSNFAFLALGVAVWLNGGILLDRGGYAGLVIIISAAFLPLFYLVLLDRLSKPLTRLLRKVPWWRSNQDGSQVGRWADLVNFIEQAENEAEIFIKTHSKSFKLVVILSGSIWLAIFTEFMLAARFLGMDLTAAQGVSVLTAARFAFLMPFPGGVGSLEAALVLVTQALGSTAATGAALSLLIRVRDIIFGLVGLWLGRNLFNLK